MAKPSKAVMAFMEKFGVESDEIWEVHGSTWVVKHKALERVAAQQGIVWDKPELKVCDMEKGFIAILVGGRLGEHTEYSFGEAAPKNNKNSYPIAMAEKRAKDRVILKLLAAHGDLYSEEEADDFKRQNPHVTRATDIHDGPLSADIPDVPTTKMKVKDARPEFKALVAEMGRIQDPRDLYDWAQARADTINSFPGEWPKIFRGEYTKHLHSLTGEAAE